MLMSVDALIFVIIIILLMITILIISIYALLSAKKRKHLQLIEIRNKLEPLIAQHIIDESPATEDQLQDLKQLITSQLGIQFMIDELIRCKQNYTGKVSETIVAIYLGLDLKRNSEKKIQQNNSWHIRARGIQELYIMEQKDSYEEIFKFTNASNEYLRNEAQTGMIYLLGAKGLDFLEDVLYPISDWQQLKLLEQLKRFPKKNINNFMMRFRIIIK
jgi:hypothetical protein